MARIFGVGIFWINYFYNLHTASAVLGLEKAYGLKIILIQCGKEMHFIKKLRTYTLECGYDN